MIMLLLYYNLNCILLYYKYRLGNTYQQTVKLMGLKETLSVDIKSNRFLKDTKNLIKIL